jgi:PAS domain S-box-containing protein
MNNNTEGRTFSMVKPHEKFGHSHLLLRAEIIFIMTMAAVVYVGVLVAFFLDLENKAVVQSLIIAVLVVIIALILGFFLVRGIANDIAAFVHAVEEVSRGHLNYRMHLAAKDEFGALERSFNRMTKSLQDMLVEKDSVIEKAKSSEEKYRSLFEKVRHGVFISSKEGSFIDCNQTLLNMLGYENKEEFLRLDIARDLYWDAKDREVFQGLVERDGFVKDFEVIYKKKDGEKIPILLTSHAKRGRNEEITHYEGLMIDITERKKTEEKLRDLNTWYLEVLGFATHEIKQHLAILEGYLIMLRDETIGPLSTDSQRQAVASLLDSTYQLIEMSDKYLRLSKIETGELEVMKRRFHLVQEVIGPLIHREMMGVNEKKMTITLENREAFERVEIEADPLLMETVYANLLSNAIKYGRVGGEISLGFKEGEHGFTFYVRNQGDGIPPDKLEAVFGKFTRLHEDYPLKGSGLGLYNTKEIIERHGGRIWAESEEGKWANFLFVLPKARRGGEPGCEQ